MRVVLFGATGMIGQGVLRACLGDARVTSVLLVGRTSANVAHPKVREIVHKDMQDLGPIAPQLTGLDACFFCLGVTSAGMNEADYTRVTHDLTLGAARILARANPRMRFLYVSGAGTDSTERGRSMWARVKGRTENALLALPFEAYALRPGYIQPMDDIRSKTGWYRAFYAVGRPFYPLLKRMAPGSATSTREMGRAMIRVASEGAPKRVLEGVDLARLGGADPRA